MSTMSQPTDSASWFEQEKPLLYDYLVRMTGDPDPASTTLLEVLQAVSNRLRGKSEDTADVRLVLYQTARSFCADRWHRVPKELIEQVYQGINDQGQLQELEGYLSTFESFQREALFLKFRYSFQAPEIAKITGKSLVKIQELLNLAVLNIRKQFPDFETQTLKQLPLFKIQDVEEVSTQALSKILKIEKLDRFVIFKSLVWCILILVSVAYYLYFG